VVLSNSALRPIGISYKAKLHALRQLEAAGMVAVDCTERGSPRMTVLWVGKSEPWRAQELTNLSPGRLTGPILSILFSLVTSQI
jgi:hypothetical protein